MCPRDIADVAILDCRCIESWRKLEISSWPKVCWFWKLMALTTCMSARIACVQLAALEVQGEVLGYRVHWRCCVALRHLCGITEYCREGKVIKLLCVWLPRYAQFLLWAQGWASVACELSCMEQQVSLCCWSVGHCTESPASCSIKWNATATLEWGRR
jgi:hypothetical protein